MGLEPLSLIRQAYFNPVFVPPSYKLLQHSPRSNKGPPYAPGQHVHIPG